MAFRKLMKKLLPGLKNDPTSSGAKPDKISAKSTSESSRSSSKTSLLAQPPPSYEEVTATATTTTKTGNTNSNLSSLGQLADVLFALPGPRNDRTDLFLSKEGKSVLFLYYLLVNFQLPYMKVSPKCKELPQHQVEGPPAAARAMINAVGNYAFMLALLHASKQYNIAGGRLSLPVDEAVYAICQHVKGQIVEYLLQNDRYKESRHVMQELVDDVADGNSGLNRLVEYFDNGLLGGRETSKTIRDSINTGELDGAKVQECWSLFKIVLAERTTYTSSDLLPPQGFSHFKDESQAAFREDVSEAVGRT